MSRLHREFRQSRQCDKGVIRSRIGRLWPSWKASWESFGGREWGLLASIAGDVGNAHWLLELWGASRTKRYLFTESTWGSFVGAARRVGRGVLVREVWQECRAFQGSLNVRTLCTCARAAAEVNDRSLLREVWASSAAQQREFDAAQWCSFALAAGQLHDAGLLREIWASCAPTEPQARHRLWGVLSTAAAETGDVKLLTEVWERCEQRKLRPPTLGAFAKAAGDVGNRSMLHEIWAASVLQRDRLGLKEWCSLARAAGLIKDASLLKQVWDSFWAKPKATDAWFWGTFAASAGEVKDSRLLGEIWSASRHTRHRLGEAEWASFATACEKTQAGPLLREVWRECGRRRTTVQMVHWGAFAMAAVATADAALLMELWQAANRQSEKLPNVALGAFVNAAGQLGLKAFLQRLWSNCGKGDLDEHIIEAFGTAAARMRDTLLLQDIWRSCSHLHGRLSAKTWGSLGKAAGDAGFSRLLREIWGASQPARPAFGGPDMASFVSAAGAVRDVDLVRDIWETSAPLRASFKPHEWGSFALAAGRARDRKLLWNLWDYIREAGIGRDDKLIGSLAAASGEAREERLLSALWEESRSIRRSFSAIVWVSFAKAAGRMGNSSLLELLWEAARALPWNVILASAFITSSGNTGDRELLRKMWFEWQPRRGEFDLQMWASLATAAGKTHDGQLLQFVWRQCQPQLHDSDPALWGAFATAAGVLGDGPLLQTLWTACHDMRAEFDPTAWGSLAMAAARVGNRDLLGEIWQKCQDHSKVVADPDLQATFAAAAGRMGDVSFLVEIWNDASASCRLFTDRNWASFAIAAGKLRHGRLLREICATHGFDRPSETPSLWGAFSVSAGDVGNRDLLRELWSAPAIDRGTLEPRELAAFASAARHTGDRALVGELWKIGSRIASQFNRATWATFQAAVRDLGDRELQESILQAEVEQALDVLRGAEVDAIRVQLADLYRKREFGHAFLSAALGRLDAAGGEGDELEWAIATYLMRAAIWGAFSRETQVVEERVRRTVEHVLHWSVSRQKRFLFRFLFAGRGLYLEHLDDLALKELWSLTKQSSEKEIQEEVRHIVLRYLRSPSAPFAPSPEIGIEFLPSSEWRRDLGWEDRPCCFDPVREEFGVEFQPPKELPSLTPPGLTAWRFARHLAAWFWPGPAASFDEIGGPVFDMILGRCDEWRGSISVTNDRDRVRMDMVARFNPGYISADDWEKLLPIILSRLDEPPSFPCARVDFTTDHLRQGILKAQVLVNGAREDCMPSLQPFFEYMATSFQEFPRATSLEDHRMEAQRIWDEAQWPEASPDIWTTWITAFIAQHALLASLEFITDRSFHRALHDLKREIETKSKITPPDWRAWLARMTRDISRLRMSRLAAFSGQETREPIELLSLLIDISAEEGIAPPVVESSGEESGSLWLWGYQILLRRAMLCLAHNAVTTAGKPDDVKMILEVVWPKVQITITNSDRGDRRGFLPATGYGLADASKIIQEHGGRLDGPHQDSSQMSVWKSRVVLPLAGGMEVPKEGAMGIN